YLRHVLAPLTANGWEACVVNSRGCAESQITSGVLYNARATWDVRQTVKWLQNQFPNRPLFGIGFSLGANILTNVRERHPFQHNYYMLTRDLRKVSWRRRRSMCFESR